MNKDQFDKLLERYLAGKTSPEEEQWFERFFQSYQKGEHNREFDQKESIKYEIYNQIRQQVGPESKVKTLWPVWLKVAAILLMVVGIGWMVTDIAGNKEKIKLLTKKTARGEKSTIMLSDGTKVRLNSESSLVYPENFTENQREVTLYGEGFFQVTKNPEQPFIVHTTGLSTKVLGTSFNISTYPEEQPKITVQEGKVEVSVTEDSTTNVRLLANQQALFTGKDLLKEEVADVEQFVGWKDGIIKLNQTSLEEMAQILERWYNVDINFEDPKLKDCTFSGKFTNDQLLNILKSIQFIKKIDFTFQDDHTIILNGNPC